MKPSAPTVSIAEAQERCGVSRRTIYNWIAAGRLEYFRTAGGAIRIVEDSLWRPGAPRTGSRFNPGPNPALVS